MKNTIIIIVMIAFMAGTVASQDMWNSSYELTKPVWSGNITADSETAQVSWHAWDGSVTTPWVSNTERYHYNKIDLGNTYSLIRFWMQARPIDDVVCLGNFSIEYSTNDVDWTDWSGRIEQGGNPALECSRAEPMVGSNRNYYNFTNFSVTARYVRVNITDSRSDGANNEAVIYEVGITRFLGSISYPTQSQYPANFTLTGLNGQPINITYEIYSSNLSLNESSIKLFYQVSDTQPCWRYINGTCTYSSYANNTYTSNISGNYTWILNASDVYPGTHNIEPDYLSTLSKSQTTLTDVSEAISLQFNNVSTTADSYLAINFNATTIGNQNINPIMYYCNSTYDFASDITNSSNCRAFNTIRTNATFNFSQSQSQYLILPLHVNQTKIGSVSVTPTSYVIIRSRTNQNTYSQRYTTEVSYPNQLRKTTDDGATWTPITGTADAYLIQLDEAGSTFQYYAQASDDLTPTTQSTITSDLFDLEPVGITSPVILYPFITLNMSYTINATWTNSFGYTSTTYTYNVSLLNPDYSHNLTINTTTTTSTAVLNNTIPAGNYHLKIEAFDDLGQYNYDISPQFTRTPRINITANDARTGSPITNFTLFMNDTVLASTSTGSIFLETLNLGQYNITIDAPLYAILNELVIVDAVNDSHVYSLYNTNSILITVRDETTNVLVDPTTITFTSNTTEFTNTTTAGVLYVSYLDDNQYSIGFSATGYNTRSYDITVGNRSHQVLNAYLPNSSTAQTTIFSISDQDTGVMLPNVTAIMYKIINGTWQAIENRQSDISGSIQFSYIPLSSYKFYLSKSEYNDNLFYLNPILYSTYNIKMSKTTNIPYEVDFDNIAIHYTPTSFTNLQYNNFTFNIMAFTGNLITYGINLTYPTGNAIATGSSAIGGILSTNIFINVSSVFDTVQVDYYYVTTTGGRRNFTTYLPIINPYGAQYNQTFMANKDFTYGLGIFERVLIVTLIIIFVVGIATLVGQPVAGLALAIFCFGYMSYIGFVPLWTILPSCFIGFMFLIWKSGGQ